MVIYIITVFVDFFKSFAKKSCKKFLIIEKNFPFKRFCAKTLAFYIGKAYNKSVNTNARYAFCERRLIGKRDFYPAAPATVRTPVSFHC